MSQAFQRALDRARAATAATPPPSSEPANDEAAAEEPDAGDEGDSETGDGEPEAESDLAEGENAKSPTKTGEPDLETVKALFSAGKIRQLGRLLGVKPEAFDVHPARLRKAREAEEALAKRQEALDADKRAVAAERAELVTARAKADFADTLEQSVAREDWVGLARLVQSKLPQGMTFGQLTARIAAGASAPGASPEVLRELAELKRWREEQEKQRKQLTEEQQREADHAHIRSQLSKHPIARLEGFEQQVREAMRAAWDPRLQAFNRTLKEVADEIVTREKQRAAKLLGVKPTARPKQKASARARTEDGRFAVPAPAPDNTRDAAYRRALLSARSKVRPAR